MKNFIKMVCFLLMFSLCCVTCGATSTKPINKNDNLCIYVMHSPNKKFCEYRKTVIHDLAKYYKVVVIANGELNDTCDEVEQIIVRPNTGYDFGAWKEYLLNNYDYVKQFDNVLLANDSFFRVLPLDRVVEQGINGTTDLFSLTKTPSYLQSYFINVKKRVTNSDAFFNFWRTMPEIKTHDDAVKKGEVAFTQNLIKVGFSIKSFTNLGYGQTKKLILDYNFPILKKKLLRG